MANEAEELKKRIREAAAKVPPTRTRSSAADEPLRPPPGAVRETPGRIGLVSPESRASTREAVRDLGGLSSMATEALPSITGTGLGTMLGTPFGPVGMIAGGAIGGFAGELLGQESGISPENDLALQTSAIPLGLGPAAGATAKLARRATASSFMSLPSVQAAVGRIARQRAANEFESFGTQIIASRFGVDAKRADELYAMAKETGAAIPVEGLTDTFKVIGRTLKEYGRAGDLPNVKPALKRADAMMNTFLSNGLDVGIDDLITIHRAMNDLVINGGERGLKAEITEEVFDALNRDLDRIAKSGNKGARYVTAAYRRASLDMAIGRMEREVAKHTKLMPGTDDLTVNVGALRQWVTNVTNPKHKDYNKRVADSLKKDLPAIKKTLETWSKYSENSNNPAGPGSIVLRGLGARTGAGVAGYFLGGPVGGVVGALAGASFPEKMTSMLVSPKGRQFMSAVLNVGKGTVRQDRWQVATQLANQIVTRPIAKAQEEEELSVGP